MDAGSVNQDDLAGLIQEHFGLTATSIQRLPGDEDLNLRVETWGAGIYLVRLYVSGVPRQTIEFQRGLIRYAAHRDPGLGKRLQQFVGDDPVRTVQWQDRPIDAAAMTFLPGRLMSAVRPHAPALLRDVGATLGRLDRALEGYTGRPAPRASDEPSWTLTDAADVIDTRLGDIEPGPLRRDRIARIRDRYRDAVEPRLGALRRGVVHQDGNDNNVLVDVAPGVARVSGLIDFGDAAHTVVVAEPAIAAGYAALGKRDPLGAIAQVVAGYHGAYPLSDEELEVLYDLALLRLAGSLAVSSSRAAAGGASEYHLVTQAPAWRALDQLDGVAPAFALAALRDAAGLAPRPRTASFVAWARARTFAPVLGRPIDDAPRVDLSVASPLLIEGGRDRTMAEWGAAIESLRAGDGASCAAGFFDESRLLYGTAAFAEEREDGPEPRTVHLGIDLFAPAGTPVHAPLDGVVASAARNDAPLDYGPTVLLEHEGPNGPFWTLYGHLDGEVLDRLAAGQRIARGERFARFGGEEENGGWPPHLHFQVVLDRLGNTGDFPGVAAPSRRRAWTAFSPDPAPLLGLAVGSAHEPTSAELLGERRAHFCTSMSISYERPITMVKGRGTTLFDAEGRAFLDAVNNVPHVGHCHPRVVAAAQQQAALLATNTRYLNRGLHRYAEKLRAKLPAHLEVLYFLNSGSEANEVALRLAAAATGGARDVIVQEHGYHGHTGRTVACSHYKFARQGGFAKPDWVHPVPCPDPVRGRHRGVDSGDAYVREVEAVIESLRSAGRRPRALLAEAIVGCGGQVVPPAGYLKGAFEAVRRAGGVAIADEVQVGFGRVGTHFWAFDEQGAVPDIVSMGKPIGNGHPMAAVATTREIASAFAGGMEFFATFGGNNVSAAIGEAVLDVLDDEDLMARAQRVGATFFERAKPLIARHPCVADVRGRGLYVGVELLEPGTERPAGAAASHVANRMRDRGILISTDGPHGNVLKIKPPLVFTEEEMVHLVETLDQVLQETAIESLTRHETTS